MYKIPECGMSIAIDEYSKHNNMHAFRSYLNRFPGLCCKALLFIADALLTTAAHTPTQSFRLTGFTFTHGSRTSANGVGAVHLASSSSNSPQSNMRVDHCHFDHINGRDIQTDGWVYGVADHNYIVAESNGQSFYINCANYGGYTFGHGAWADYSWFGTNRFFFIEANTIVGNGIVTT